MIEHDTLLSIPFLKKSRFTGSDRGMRYSIYKIEETRIIQTETTEGPSSDAEKMGEEAPKEEKVTLRGSSLPGTVLCGFHKTTAVY